MKSYKFCKMCLNCGTNNYFDEGLDLTNEENEQNVDFVIQLDFIGYKDFNCEECGSYNSCGELEWELNE